ncbi:hypothetical protein DX980_20925 [Burkholderia gladioli]|nr:hypothetical protein DX980_20925 [Burkholderia gladioli]
MLQFASTSFDASISEVVMALCRGAALYVPADGIRHDRQALWAYLEREAITHATLPPALLQDGGALPPIATRPTLALVGEAPGAALFRALAGRPSCSTATGRPRAPCAPPPGAARPASTTRPCRSGARSATCGSICSTRMASRYRSARRERFTSAGRAWHAAT